MVTVNLQIDVTAVQGALNTVKRKIPRASSKGIAQASVFVALAIKDRTRRNGK